MAGLDGSRASERALELAGALAAQDASELHVVSVVEEGPPYVAARHEEERDAADARAYYAEIQRSALARLHRRGIVADGQVAIGNEARSLIDAVRRHGADLLAIGNASHSGVWGTALGSTAHKLAHASPVSVLVARDTDGPITQVVIGYDGSANSQRALAAGTDAARALGARILVAEKPRRPATHPNARRDLASALARTRLLEEAGPSIVATPDRDLLRLAREGHGRLMVIGATGDDHPWSRDLGNTAAALLERAEVSILVVRMPLATARVSQIMRRQVRTIRADTTAREAAGQLLRMGVKTLIVVDASERPTGIVTLSDLLDRVGGGLRHGVASALSEEEVEGQLVSLFHSDLRCGEIMTRDPVTVGSDSTLDDALALMAGRDIKRIPVVDEQGKLAGLLSRADALRALAGWEEGHPSAIHRVAGARTAAELMRSDVATVSIDAPLEETARAVLSSDLGRVAVADPEGRLVGVIALRDLLPLASAEGRAQLVDLLARPTAPREAFLSFLRRHPVPGTAGALMRRDVITVRPRAPLAEVLDMLMTYGIRRILVVDDERRVAGAVDRDDVLRALAERVAERAGA